MSEDSYFDLLQREDVTVLILREPLHADTLMFGDLRDKLFELAEKKKPSKLIISYRDFERVSTEVINILLTLQKRLESVGGQLKLCEMSNKVRSSYRLLKLDGTVFDIYGTLSEAAANFSESAI